MPSELLTWQPMDPNDLSSSTHSLDRDSLSSFVTTSSIALPPTPTPSLHETPAIESGHTPLPSVTDDDMREHSPEEITQQEEEASVINDETPHEQAESTVIPEIVQDGETPPGGEEGVTQDNADTVEKETTADGKRTPDSELEGHSADKEPLLQTVEDKERGERDGRSTLIY